RDGSGFIASHSQDFLYANDRWFRGINLKYGPDGSVYLIDWYDPNACHRNQPEIWDRTNGRIYRISYGDQQPVKVDLAKVSSVELVKLHEHENDWYVRTARRLLQERASKLKIKFNPRKGVDENPSSRAEDFSHALSALDKLTKWEQDPARRLRYIWTLHAAYPGASTYAVHSARRLMAKGPNSEYIRAWGVQLELEDHKAENVILKMFADMAANDPSPVVRLYLASGLQRLPLEQRWDIARNLLQHADDANDHNLPLMDWYAVEPLVPADPDRALALAAESKIPLVSQYIYRRAAADPAALPKLLTAIGSAPNDKVQQVMLAEVAAVAKSSGQLPMPANWPEVYAKLAQSENAEVRQQSQFITVKFGDNSIFPALRSMVLSASESKTRTEAIATLVAGKDPELPPVLFKLLHDPTINGVALRALASFDAPETPAEILSHYAEFDDAAKGDALATLSSRTPYALALLGAVDQGTIPRTDLKAYHVTQMQQLKSDELLARLNTVWGAIRSTPEEKLKQIAQYKRTLLPKQLDRADLPHGRELYAKNCGKCHKLFGDGGAIGPDITGSNRANLDYILQNIVDPSALVGKDYQTTTLVTKDGRVLNGLVKEENDSAVTLQTANEVIVVDKQEIEDRKLSEQSLMPEGQLKDWPQSDVQDLVAYLASPRQVPLPGAGPVYDDGTKKVLGAIEGETIKIVSKSAGNAAPQAMGGFSKDKWSGDNHLWWTGAKPGDKLTLSFPVREAGKYELFAVMTKARDYGIVQQTLDGRDLGGPIDLYNNPDVITTGPVSLGSHELSAGDHQLTVTITGANAAAIKGYMFGLDYIFLGRLPLP
ncbi:MAG: c-type cytochrome, partial [Planctomycetaceae bacterium]